MRRHLGPGWLVVILLLALVAGASYTAYAGSTIYQHLDSGRQELVAAQASLNAATRSADPLRLQTAASRLKQAERDFDEAATRLQNDPAIRLVGGIPAAGRQLDAVTHLAAIGADLSRAGEAAAVVAIQVAGLEQRYAGRSLSDDDLQAILQQAQIIAKTYSGSIQAIARQLRAAHAERARVTTTDLVSALKGGYQEVDRALVDADTAFLRYQDVRQVLSDVLGRPLPA